MDSAMQHLRFFLGYWPSSRNRLVTIPNGWSTGLFMLHSALSNTSAMISFMHYHSTGLLNVCFSSGWWHRDHEVVLKSCTENWSVHWSSNINRPSINIFKMVRSELWTLRHLCFSSSHSQPKRPWRNTRPKKEIENSLMALLQRNLETISVFLCVVCYLK